MISPSFLSAFPYRYVPRNAIVRTRPAHCLEIRGGRSPPIYASRSSALSSSSTFPRPRLPLSRSDHFCSFREPFWSLPSQPPPILFLFFCVPAYASFFPCTQFVPFELERGESSTSASRDSRVPGLHASCCRCCAAAAPLPSSKRID